MGTHDPWRHQTTTPLASPDGANGRCPDAASDAIAAVSSPDLQAPLGTGAESTRRPDRKTAANRRYRASTPIPMGGNTARPNPEAQGWVNGRERREWHQS